MEQEVNQNSHNIDDFNSVMTVYYVKRTGAIKTIADGRQDMSLFGEEEFEYTQIWNYTVVEKDDFVRNNVSEFCVDLDTKELIYTPLIDTSKYRMR